MRSAATCIAILLLACSAACAADVFPAGFQRLPSQYPEPGLTFGQPDESSKPMNLLFSASPDEILADAEEWKKRGLDGFFMTGCVGGWPGSVWNVDGEPWTIGRSDKTLQKATRATELCKRLGMETFPLMAFSRCFDWFDDVAWQHIDHNFRQFALFAREAGCPGVAIEYIGDQYFFQWDGYEYDGYTEEDPCRRSGIA